MKLQDEKGAETVEFAIALPILLVTAIAIIQLCLAGLQIMSLDAQITKGSWDVNATALATSADKNAYVRDAIAEGALLDKDGLTIENCVVTSYTEQSKSDVDSKVKDELNLEEGQLVHDKAVAHVEADLKYRIASIINLPGLSGVTLNRHLSHDIVDNDRIEIR